MASNPTSEPSPEEVARQAALAADTRARFAAYEARGLARQYWVEDGEPYDDSYVDTWGEPPEEVARIKAAIRRDNERYGVWGCVTHVRRTPVSVWEHADSLWAITFSQPREQDPYTRDVEAEGMWQAVQILDRWADEEARELRYRATYAGPTEE